MTTKIQVKCQGHLELTIDSLEPFQGNLKTLSEPNYKKLRNLLIDQGFSFPFFVWQHKGQNFILDGHQRLKTIQRMRDEGYSFPGHLPCALVHADSYKEAKEKVLSATTQMGEMSYQGLYDMITENGIDRQMLYADYRFAEIDFPSFEKKFFEDNTVPPIDQSNEDSIPNEKSECAVKLGDIWKLGEHRLACGDCTDVMLIDALVTGQTIDMVFTDPPYGIAEKGDKRSSRKKTQIDKTGKNYKKIEGDDTIDTALEGFSVADSLAPIVCYWGGNYFAHQFPPSPCWLVWDKRVEEKQHDDNSDCELAYVKHPSKKSVRIFRHLWKGLMKGSERGERRVHPTQKPVALAEWAIPELDPSGTTVVDLFLGSGSTLIACEKLKRRCLGVELDPEYCATVISRWENLTGKTAVLLNPSE